MRYLALASDYDGTLAHDGVVTAETVAALQRVAASGRKLIMITGRELDDLEGAFPELSLFDRVVAENGALLFNPSTRGTRLLAQGPPAEFAESLRLRGVKQVTTGAVIISTMRPNEQAVIDAIHDSGLDLHAILNKESLMILPAGVDKMTGLTAALEDLQVSRHNVVGIGDAENDQVFLRCCGLGVAVSNSISSLKRQADFVTDGARGDGVIELADKLIETDLAEFPQRQAIC